MRKTSIVVLLLLTSFHLRAAAPEKIRLHFDSDRSGAAPAFLRFEASEGLPSGTWKSVEDKHAITLENVAVQTSERGSAGQYRFALSTEARQFLDGKVVVSVKKQGGCGSPCRGGLAVRFRDPKNFLGVLWDFEGAGVSLVDVRKGKPKIVASGTVQSNEPLWRTISVDLSGPRVEVSVSEKQVFEAVDSKPAAGAAGLVTEAGSVIGFDELAIDPR
jgi:hypothetical protein